MKTSQTSRAGVKCQRNGKKGKAATQLSAPARPAMMKVTSGEGQGALRTGACLKDGERAEIEREMPPFQEWESARNQAVFLISTMADLLEAQMDKQGGSFTDMKVVGLIEIHCAVMASLEKSFDGLCAERNALRAQVQRLRELAGIVPTRDRRGKGRRWAARC